MKDPFFEKDKMTNAGNVVAFTAEQYGISHDELVGSSTKQQPARARFIAYYILHENYKFSLVEIGKIFGRHHTSVLYGVQYVKRANIGPEVIEAYKAYEK